jgi:hypothetical protein
MKLPICLIFTSPFLAFAYPTIIEHTEVPNRRIQTHDDPIHALHPRDSVTIDIKNTFSNSTVYNSQNNIKGKFEVVNNAKNANIAVGDHSNHTADFHSFGDKNMLNSTGSNTGGWNTKNQETNLATGEKGKRATEQKPITTEGNGKRRKVGRYRNFGARQTKNGYRWDGNMRSGGAKLAPCEPTGYAYLAEQCVPTSRSKSRSNKSNSTGSAEIARAVT